MFHNKKWTRELCVQRVDEFVRREQRYPTPQERTPKCGLPSDTAFRGPYGHQYDQILQGQLPGVQQYESGIPTSDAA